jgi:hypothetical protein
MFLDVPVADYRAAKFASANGQKKTAPAAGRPGPLARTLGLGGAMEEEAGNPT